jgi:hypothetical protein
MISRHEKSINETEEGRAASGVMAGARLLLLCARALMAISKGCIGLARRLHAMAAKLLDEGTEVTP